MEQEVGEILWGRSIARNHMRYTTMLSDGDTKTFDHLTILNIYSDEHPIDKEKCVNHIAKHMRKALCTLKTEAYKKEMIVIRRTQSWEIDYAGHRQVNNILRQGNP